MKKILFLVIIPLLVILVFTHNSQSKTKSYYSGDAINFNDELYVSSANSGNIEVFKLQDNSLNLIAKVRNFNGRFNRYDDFSDSKLSVEGNHLFVYATSGFTLNKYEIVNDHDLSLISSQQNTYWEWYNRIDKFGDNIITISDKGIKVWNKDLQVIDGYGLTNNKTPYNIHADGNKLILDIQNNRLTVFNRESRTNLVSVPLNYQNAVGNRRAYQDENNNIYVVDDYYAKKFNLEGKLLASFEHIDQPGYDVGSTGVTNYLYFSNGAGVVKLNMETMREVTYAWTGGLGGARGWAMGLKAVNANGDKIVVFNNSNILVLNSNLKKIAAYTATEEETDSSSLENLTLNLDHNLGTPLTSIVLSGTGYFPNENLNISFADSKTTTKTDNRGRFRQTIIVPDIIPLPTNGGVDIKVDGVNSKLSYSISFKIIK